MEPAISLEFQGMVLQVTVWALGGAGRGAGGGGNYLLIVKVAYRYWFGHCL